MRSVGAGLALATLAALLSTIGGGHIGSWLTTTERRWRGRRLRRPGQRPGAEMLTLLTLLVLPVLAGLVAGWLHGGRPARLAALRPRAPWLAWLAVAAQLAQAYAPAVRQVVEADLGVPMLLLVYATLGLWLVLNLPGRPIGIRVAVLVLLLGGSMNGLAIAANGRMPFSVPAAQRAGVPAAKVAATDLPKNEPAAAGTRLAWLGDNIPVRPLRKVVSAGDLVIVLGIALLVMAGTSARQQPPRDPDAHHA